MEHLFVITTARLVGAPGDHDDQATEEARLFL
jgi:hypothetical protein